MRLLDAAQDMGAILDFHVLTLKRKGYKIEFRYDPNVGYYLSDTSEKLFLVTITDSQTLLSQFSWQLRNK